MRVLVAPDVVSEPDAPVVPAIDVAAHLADGWTSARPADVVRVHPLSTGGRGLLDVVRTAVGGVSEAAVARDAYGSPVPTAWLQVDGSAVVETAPLLADPDGDDALALATSGTSAGAGDLLRAALTAGARRIVIGAAASGVHDAGIGALRALCDADEDVPPDELVRLATDRLAGVEVVVAAVVDGALTGLDGAGAALARRPGIDAATAQQIEGRLSSTIARMESAAVRPRPSLLGTGPAPVRRSRSPHAGAAGGLAFALACAGARVLPGADVVAVETGLERAVADADLVLTACGELDGDALAIGVPGVVGRYAGAVMVPSVAVAARTLLGRRELAGTGIEAAYPLVDPVAPGRSAALVPLPEALSRRAGRVARTWSR